MLLANQRSAMLDIDKESLQTALKELKQAIYNHELWHKDLTRTMVGRLPCEEQDIAKNAHHLCCLGLWFYQQAPVILQEAPAFAPLRVSHKYLHQRAAQLLTKLATEPVITVSEYDEFNVELDQFRLEVKTLEREIEGILYNHDPLTGAKTQVAMLSELSKLTEQSRQHIQTCCIAVMSIDHLTRLHATYGHEIGDRALSVSVRYILEQLRPYDKVFLYYKDKFLITMPGTDLQTSYQVIERIRQKLHTIAVAYAGPQPLFITASFGLALLDPDASTETNIQRADRALEAAKTAGCNCTYLWDSSLNEDS